MREATLSEELETEAVWLVLNSRKKLAPSTWNTLPPRNAASSDAGRRSRCGMETGQARERLEEVPVESSVPFVPLPGRVTLARATSARPHRCCVRSSARLQSFVPGNGRARLALSGRD